LEFLISGKAHYGWARFNVKIVYEKNAYETLPKKPIIAGKTHGPDVVAVQDATLGHLARGASAISPWPAKEQ